MATSLGGSARQSNLQSFLDRTTPIVPSQLLPKACFRDLNRLWHPLDSESIEYFTLKDLWRCYEEWSAYGVGAPIVLNGEGKIVQYYVPSLSAIQLYTSTDHTSSDLETTSDSCSTSYESASDKLWRSDIGSSEDCWHFNNEKLGHLNFQYFETEAPQERPPLMNKINELAEGFPGLMTLKSVDLSPASWMAVAWYPIYRISKGKTVPTAFLTYHTLSSSFQDHIVGSQGEMECTIGEKLKKTNGTVLDPFGLVTYKMQGCYLWASADNGRDRDRVSSLLGAADSWLKQLGVVQHHDFSYFTGIRRRH